MKKILVTGATGFIGNYVVKELLKNNCQVIATSQNEYKASSFPWFPQVKFIPFDLKDYDNAINYFEYFHKPDAMIHLAWEGLPNFEDDFHIVSNLPRHYRFLQNILHNGLKDITITGTCLEYGLQEGCLMEDSTALPGTAYANAKDSLRKMLLELQLQEQFIFKWVRLFYMFGNGQNANSILAQLDKAIALGEPSFNMSGGEQVRDYLPVEQVAKYLVKIALQNKVIGIINCCSGKPITIKELVMEHLHRKGASMQLNMGYYPYPAYEPMRFWGDTHKLNLLQ